MGNTVVVILACKDCKNRNYSHRRGDKKGKSKLEIKKFCPKCRRRTVHRVTK